MGPFTKKKMLDALSEEIHIWTVKKLIKDFRIKFFSLHGNGDTMRIGQEIQCLPYAGFSFECVRFSENTSKYLLHISTQYIFFKERKRKAFF